MAVAGIPLWITELDFASAQNDSQRADFLEAVVREAFAHAAVQGVVFWQAGRAGCEEYRDTDPAMCKPCVACFADANFVDNEVGKR